MTKIASDPDVVTAQKALNVFGYGLLVDGVFGKKTLAATQDVCTKLSASSATQKTIDGLKAQLADASGQLDGLTSKLAVSQAIAEAQGQQIDSYKKTVADLNTQISSLESLGDVSTAIADIKATIGAEHDALAQQLADLLQTLTNLLIAARTGTVL